MVVNSVYIITHPSSTLFDSFAGCNGQALDHWLGGSDKDWGAHSEGHEQSGDMVRTVDQPQPYEPLKTKLCVS